MEVHNLSDHELRVLLAQAREMLSSLAASLDDRPDLLQALQALMRSTDMFDTYVELSGASSDVMRLVLQASVAALINVHSAECLDAELKRRAVQGN